MLDQNECVSERLVIVSILNWNTAEMTLACVKTLRALEIPDGVKLDIIVIDNDSAEGDFARLMEVMPGHGVTVHRQEKNLGFAGGTNVAIELAREKRAAFIWLVNSDALVEQVSTLTELVAMMDNVPQCGAASPKLILPDPPYLTYFCGAYHDWARRLSVRTDETRGELNEKIMAADTWVPGTALFLRVEALEQVGPLDERFFAYYEDDEICARLAKRGWLSRVCFDVAVKHSMPRAETDRPPYYFYLMQRNHLMFWYENTPAAHRRLLWLKLMDQAFFDVNKLRRKGFHEHADAASLGIQDFLRKQYGAPNLKRKVPLALRLVTSIAALIQTRALNTTLMPALGPKLK